MMIDRPTLCLVDDEQDVLEGLLPVLTQAYDVKVFSDPLLALEAFDKGFSPDIVISDLRMPQMHGMDFIQEIKSRKNPSKIVVSSGHADKAAALKALNIGVDAFIEKPFTMKQLKEMLKNVVAEIEFDRRLIEDLKELNRLYFDRLVHAENLLYDSQIPYPGTPAQKAQFAKWLKEERDLNFRMQKHIKVREER